MTDKLYQQIEIWKDIPGYEGLYQVSNFGRVKSLKRIDSLGRISKETILKHDINKKGYFRVCLYKNNRIKQSVHRLVAKSFLGVSDLQVNHINGNKNDNRLENIEYVTNRENQSHRFLGKGTSKYTGVYWNKERSKWQAQINIKGKTIQLGRFVLEERAKKAYEDALCKYKIKNKYSEVERILLK